MNKYKKKQVLAAKYKNMKYKKMNKYKKTGVGGPRLHLGLHLLRRLAGRPLGLAGSEVVKVFSIFQLPR